MPEEILIQIPKKLAEFIDELTEQGYFKSREDFSRCSLEIIAQLYGLAKTAKDGKSLLDILTDNKVKTTKADVKTKVEKVTPTKTKQPKTAAASPDLSNEEYDVLDLFTGATFEFEDALYARFTMELMKLAKAPKPKSEFLSLLKGLGNKGKIERTEHNKKVVWKIIDKYD
ncbi:MAG: ribbon-helix-helix domain-containing protein [Candidatus Heimdallarchaeota archaeon]